MGRFFKIFFGRFFLVAAAIILQVLLLIVVNYIIANNFRWVNLIFVALGVLFFLIIIDKNQPTTYKLPYLILVVSVPIIGITVYAIFGNITLSRKSQKKLDLVHQELISFCKQENPVMERLKKSSLLAYGQAKYIEHTSYLPTYDKCYVKYLPMGEDFFESIKVELQKAKKYILMEYFIIQKGKMFDEIYQILKEKARLGVDVYFIYDDVGSIGKVDKDFYLDMRNEGINACKFSPFKAFVSPIHNNRDHRKICVIDGDVGYIGGINLADEYINEIHPFGVWKDNAVLLKGKCVDSLIWMFVQLYNPYAVNKIKIENFLLKEHPQYENNGFVSPYGDGPRPMYQDYIGQTVYSTIINQAQRYVYFITPYLIVDYDFLEALKNAVKRNVKVKIILPHIPDKKMVNILTKSNYENLIASGVEIYEYEKGFCHAKMCVSDDNVAVIGTINLDYRSFVHHFECGVWLYNQESILDMRDDLEHIIETESIKVAYHDAKQPLLNRLIKDVLSIIAPMM